MQASGMSQNISRAGAVDVWCAKATSKAGLREEFSECMVGEEGKERRERGGGEVKPCSEPFSMKKPFAALVWERKLEGFYQG